MFKKFTSLFTLLVAASISFGQASSYPNGSTVANFTVTDIDGNEQDLYTITSSGKYVFLDFFFVDCPPCQATAQYFNAMYDKYGCNGGDLYCLSLNNGSDNTAAVEGFETTYGGSTNHAPVVSNEGDPGGTVSATFGVSAFPTYCLIGPDNVMIANDVWPVSSMADLEAAFPSSFNPSEQACTFAGVEETAVEVLSVYPNPAHNELNVVFNAQSETTASVVIYDLVGKKIEAFDVNTKVGSNNTQVNTSTYAEGSYIAHITLDGTVSTVRFDVVK